MSKIIRRYGMVAAAVGGLAAGILAFGPGTSMAAPALGSTTCQATLPTPPVRHVVNTGQSLDGWAATHHATVSNILEVTVRCDGGDWTQVSFVDYLDHGSLRAPLAHGTVLWTDPVVPFTAVLTAYPQVSGYYNADHALCRVFPTNFYRARNTRAVWAPKIPPTAPATRAPMSAFNVWVKRHPHGTLAQSGHLFFNAWIRCYPVVR